MPWRRFWMIFALVAAGAAESVTPGSAEEQSAHQTTGVEAGLPVFREAAVERLTFPLSWLSGRYKDFGAWRRAARPTRSASDGTAIRTAIGTWPTARWGNCASLTSV
jgi:hypothetical protein